MPICFVPLDKTFGSFSERFIAHSAASGFIYPPLSGLRSYSGMKKPREVDFTSLGFILPNLSAF
jgi:hypothetical protein